MSIALQTSVFAQDAGLAFVFFIGFSLMLALGARFSAYAFLNRRATDIGSGGTLWEFLLFAGLTAALYGLLGCIEAATAALPQLPLLVTPYRDGVLLAFLLLLALTMREVFHSDALSNAAAPNGGTSDTQRSVELGFAVVVTGAVFGTGAFGNLIAFGVVEGLAAVAFGVYGLLYARRQLGRSAVRGTTLDSLLRHLLPVVAFGVLTLAIDLTVTASLPVAVVRHIQVVFVIMTATSLMTATIKLRQNVESY